ncbi:Chromosome partition protein Smc [Paraconexibacter sp. AEG42_29]|uniref:Chromosome partition protein Smc n=1 Tax=Paraconexibacter sp. AEG42_29 TaxID=2997339 RepID=A0AAU7AZ41_9ACTN
MSSETTALKCFMHIPRSGGSTFYAALAAASPPDTVAPATHDRTVFGSFDRFADLGAPLADHVITTSAGFEDLEGRYAVVGGHLSLATLRTLVGPESVATVLREPGSRLLSLYAGLRSEPGLHELVDPYPVVATAEQPLHEFLASTRAAALTDNQVARFVLAGDARLPVDGFMSRDDAEAVAADAIARLEEFGCVTILELGSEAWNGLEHFFGVTLTPQDAAAPDGPRDGSVPFPPLTAEALALLDDRCAADALIYDHFLLQRCDDEDEARRISEMALVTQLITFGDRGGRSASRAQGQDATISELEASRAAAEARTAELSGAADAVRAELGDAGDALRDERDEARQQLTQAQERTAAAEERVAAAEERAATAEGQAAGAGKPDPRVAELEAQLAAAQAEAADAGDVRQQLADTEARLAAADAQAASAADAEQRLADVQAQLAAASSSQERVAELEKQLAAAGSSQERVAELEKQLAAAGSSQERVAKLEEQLAAAGQREDLVADLERRNAELKRQLEEQAGREADVRAELSEVRGSASWQLTAPVRAAGDRLGSFLRR